jgi:hypothetical protein
MITFSEVQATRDQKDNLLKRASLLEKSGKSLNDLDIQIWKTNIINFNSAKVREYHAQLDHIESN